MPTTQINDLSDLMVYELRDLYHAERQFVAALPELEKNAIHTELKTACKEYTATTQLQIERLESLFDRLDIDPTGETCEAMEGLIREAREVLELDTNENVRDAALVAMLQRVMHYGIAGYGTAKTYARHLGLPDAEVTLYEIEREKSDADEGLTQLAVYKLNLEAMATV